MQKNISNYSQALYNLQMNGLEYSDLDFDEIKDFIEFFKKNPTITKQLNMPILNNKVRIQILQQLDLKSKLLYNFFKVCLEDYIMDSIVQILEETLKLFEQNKNIVRGVCYSTTKLNEEQVKKLENVFSKKLKKYVFLTNEIDKTLIGGIKVVIENKVYENSIKNKLDNLESNISR